MAQSNERHLSVVASPDEVEMPLRPEIEAAYERGEINLIQARQLSGHMALEHETESLVDNPEAKSQLELVTDEHQPRPAVRREVTLKPRRKAKNWREKQAADQAPLSQRVTPLGHDPILTVHRGNHIT